MNGDEGVDVRARSHERIRRSKLPQSEIPHGTMNGYTNYVCRCDPCRAAKAADSRAELQKRSECGPSNTPHGTANGYARWGCRCEECLAAHSENKTRRRLDANDETRKSATATGRQWTGPELEIATRADLTAREAAAILGRSYLAVEGARARCLRDPRYIKLLGAARREEWKP